MISVEVQSCSFLIEGWCRCRSRVCRFSSPVESPVSGSPGSPGSRQSALKASNESIVLLQVIVLKEYSGLWVVPVVGTAVT